jgi:hypothetical protein
MSSQLAGQHLEDHSFREVQISLSLVARGQGSCRIYPSAAIAAIGKAGDRRLDLIEMLEVCRIVNADPHEMIDVISAQ